MRSSWVARQLALAVPGVRQVQVEVYDLGIVVGAQLLVMALRGDGENGLPAYEGPLPPEMIGYLNEIEAMISDYDPPEGKRMREKARTTFLAPT